MSKSHCLCGAVGWEVLAEPYTMYNCHCRMCQKAHGTAFATYAFVRNNDFQWTSSTDNIVHYRSSEALQRSSCKTCGAVVPFQNMGGDHWDVPAGCHADMRKPDYNIFVADNSPWHVISGDLPESEAYPENSGCITVEGLAAVADSDHEVRGSCLCGEVSYRITQPLSSARNCHCSRCRHGRAAAHAANGFVPLDAIEYLSGEDQLVFYKVPDAKFFAQVFCSTCSSPMPRKDEQRNICVIPMGSLDTDPGIKTQDHIFVSNKADWHDITDDLPQFSETPPG